MADLIAIHCERCGHEQDLISARSDGEWRELVTLIMSLPPVLHWPVWNYLALFKPLKQKLRSSTMLKVVKDLEPVVKSATLERQKKEYLVNAQTFAKAMIYLYETPPKSMRLPLKDNNYLYGLLINRAEQLEAKQEQQVEYQRRNRPKRESTGEMKSCGDLMGGTSAGETEAPAKRVSNEEAKSRLSDVKKQLRKGAIK